MALTADDIYNALKVDESLCRMLPLVETIAILEYDGTDINGSRALARVLGEMGCGGNVLDVLLFAKRQSNVQDNVQALQKLFPKARVKTCKPWRKVHPQELEVHATLVIHFTELTAYNIRRKDEDFITMYDLFVGTRDAYLAVAYTENNGELFNNNCKLRSWFTLNDLRFDHEEVIGPKMQACRDKEEFLDYINKNLTAREQFFETMEELRHGCDSCPQCRHYGALHRCPMIQHRIAKYYRDGFFVPKNSTIAYQWEAMAGKQGYAEAALQAADDVKALEAYGEKDAKKVLSLLTRLVKEHQSRVAAEKIVKYVYDNPFLSSSIAIPYMAKLANDGNEEMTLRLSDGFQNGLYGLPKDLEQQKSWIESGAKNGNPRFIKAVAEMYEAAEQWKESYYWYKKLRESGYDDIDEKRIQHVELEMLTDGKALREVTQEGVKYLWGLHGLSRDMNLAFRCFLFASKKGETEAIGQLGWMYYKGIHTRINTTKGLDLLKTAAREGADLFSLDKLLDIAKALNEGEETLASLQDAFLRVIKRKIAQNDPFALYLKGKYISEGKYFVEAGGKTSSYMKKSAFLLMKKAAEQQFPPAEYRLSQMYADGYGTATDADETKRWLQVSAEHGWYEAVGRRAVEAFNTGSYAFGRDERIDIFNRLSFAANLGYSAASWPLAQCYMRGYGTALEKAKAYPLYIKAAEEGNKSAQTTLCEAYFRGDGFLPQSYTECARWGEAALAQGERSVRFETAYAEGKIGHRQRSQELYFELANEGNSVAMNNYACGLSDQAEACVWFKKASDAGESYGAWNLGRHYRDGSGVARDYDEAVRYLQLAVDRGHDQAMDALADMYRNGTGVQQDYDRAIELYEKAIEKDNVYAMKSLAWMYKLGRGVAKDFPKAIDLYKQAANKDDDFAMYYLGDIYENGPAEIKDIHRAIYWYRKGATKGNSDSRKRLEALHVDIE